MTTQYPLSWPPGWPRTPISRRVNGKSNWSHKGKPWTFDAARSALADELDAMGATNIVLSTNYELRLDGAPRAGAPKPDDCGIAVYFTYKERGLAMARDAFDRAEENIRSLTLALQALRAIERHGGSVMMERAFDGFAALPAPANFHWTVVLGVGANATEKEIDDAYRQAAKLHHPDNGGSVDGMAKIGAARRDAKLQRGFSE